MGETIKTEENQTETSAKNPTEDETASQSEDRVKMGGGATNFRPWLFKKGQSGNPSGMPKGTVSLKVWARKYLQTLTDAEKLDFIDGLPKDIIWRMAEGQPHQTTETDTKGSLKIEFFKDFNKENKEEVKKEKEDAKAPQKTA